MSDARPTSFRFSPKVSPAPSTDDERVRAAWTLLGVNLGPFGIWGDPTRAGDYWAWVRDGRSLAPDDWAGFHEWVANLVGLVGEQAEPARHFTLGFVQGVECALRGVPVPPALLAEVETRRKPRASALPKPSGQALSALREWASQWLQEAAEPFDASAAWELGLALAGHATRDNHLLCGVLSAEFDRARAEQRFAAQALARFLLQPDTTLWLQFVRSTYLDEYPEGRAIAECTRRSLDKARTHRWRLREFLLDALQAGREFAQSHPYEAERVIDVLPSETRTALTRLYTATTGPLDQTPKPELLLLSLKNWLLETHADLFDPRDTGAENLVLRHAYDFLWWRGLLSTESLRLH